MSDGSDASDEPTETDGSTPDSDDDGDSVPANADGEAAESNGSDHRTDDAPGESSLATEADSSGGQDGTDGADSSDGGMTPDEWAEQNPYGEELQPGAGLTEAEEQAAAASADPTPEVVTDGAAPAEDATTGIGEAPTTSDDDLFGEGPESDEEMPLAEHIDEMMRRLAAVFLVAGIASLTVLLLGQTSPTIPSPQEIIIFLWERHIGFEEHPPRIYGPLEFLLAKIKVVGLAGVLVGLPALVYQAYLFMRPGLYPHERRYYIAAVPTSLILAIVGMAFAHFLVLPAVFDYFVTYTGESAVIAFGLSDTFNIILVLMGYMAVVFQVPLLVQLAIMMGLVTREWLEERRLLVWGGFATVSFTFVAVDPTGMVPIIVGLTMIVLFEGTLTLLRWTGN